jgi:hypothetical protein
MNIEDNSMDEIDVNNCTTLMLNFDLNEEESISYERLFGNFDETNSSSPLTCTAHEFDFTSPQSSQMFGTNLFCKDSLSNSVSPTSISSQHLLSPEIFKDPSTPFPSTVARHYEAYQLQTPISNTHPLKVAILSPPPSLFLQYDESAENNDCISTDDHLIRKRDEEDESHMNKYSSTTSQLNSFKKSTSEPSISPIEPYASRMKDYPQSPSVTLPIVTPNTLWHDTGRVRIGHIPVSYTATSPNSTLPSTPYNSNSPTFNDKFLDQDHDHCNLLKRRKLKD